MRLWIASPLAVLAASAAAEPRLAPPQEAEVALLSGWREPGGEHVAAIDIRLAPGWHTYWRVPGASGIPPQFDWSQSQNLAAVAYEWPRPIPFETFGELTIGYKEALVLPVRLTPRDAAAPVEVRLELFFGVCKDICIPAEATLTARLDPAAPPEGRERIEAALAERPLEPYEAGVTGATCALAPRKEGVAVTARIAFAQPPAPGLIAVIEAESRPDLWIGEADAWTEGRAVHAAAPLEALGSGALALDRERLRVTLLDERHAIDIRGCPGG